MALFAVNLFIMNHAWAWVAIVVRLGGTLRVIYVPLYDLYHFIQVL